MIACLVACAMSALGSAALASAPRLYLLRHPKREHCKAHYKKEVLTVKKRLKRLHWHTRKVRETFCVRVHPKPPHPATQPVPLLATPEFILPPAEVPAPPTHRTHRTREPQTKEPACTTTFTGAVGNFWSAVGNWTGGVPAGLSSYACIPSGYPDTVVFNPTAETTTEIGGVSAENAEGITFGGGYLTIADPSQTSLINDVAPGQTAVTLDEGVVLELAGTSGELGGNSWSGPGTLEIPRGAFLRTGNCASWTGKLETVCVGGTPTPGHDGLQVKNFGTMVGAGLSLCRNGATQPAVLENEGSIRIRNSGGFESASECGEAGSVVNGQNGTMGIAELDGDACGVKVAIASFANKGRVTVGSCFTPETEDLHRAELEIGSSLVEVGTLIDRGIVDVGGDFTPARGANVNVAINETLPPGSAQTNYGTIRVAGNAALAGELNVETTYATPALGQTYQILEVEGSLSGEFTLGHHCIPKEPGDGYRVNYRSGSKGTVTLEVAEVAGC